MSYYRLYFMNSFSGHIERFEEFDATSDDEAIARAGTRLGLLVLELWCARRKVARLEALDLGSQLLAQRRVQKEAKAQLVPEADEGDNQAANRSA